MPDDERAGVLWEIGGKRGSRLVFVIQTPHHLVAAINLVQQMHSRSHVSFEIFASVAHESIAELMGFDLKRVDLAVHRDPRHSSAGRRSSILVGTTRSAATRLFRVKSNPTDLAVIFNDEAYRVQNLLYIMKPHHVVMVEEGIAPYLSPKVEISTAHRLVGSMVPWLSAHCLGESDLYQEYYVTRPDLVIPELPRDRLRLIDRDVFVGSTRYKVGAGEALILTSPSYNTVAGPAICDYLNMLDRLIRSELVARERVYLKYHPLENPGIYANIRKEYDGRVVILPNWVPTNLIEFSAEATMLSLSLTSALLYANCNRFICHDSDSDKERQLYDNSEIQSLLEAFAINLTAL